MDAHLETTGSATAIEDSDRNLTDLAGGTLVNFVGKLGRLTKGTFIAAVKVLFGAEIVGLYEVAWGVAFTLSRVGLYGLHRGVVKQVVEARVAEDDEAANRSIGAALGLGTVLSLIVVGVTVAAAPPLLHAVYPDLPTLVPALRIMIWAVPLLTLTGIFIAATRALRIMRFDVYVTSIAGPIILLGAGVLAGVWEAGLIGLSLAQIVMAIGMSLMALYYFERHFSLKACLSHIGTMRQWRVLHGFSFPVMLLELLGNIITRLDILMLAAYAGAAEAGIYAIARRAASATMKLPQSFDPIFSSIVSDLSYRRQYDELSARLVSVARWSLTVNLPVTAVVLLAGDVILSLLGEDTVMGAGALVILCLGMLVYSVFVANEQLLIMSGRQYLCLLDTLLWVGLNAGLNWWLIPDYGLVGAAVVASLTMNLINILRMAQVWVIYRCHSFHWSQLKPIGAAAAALALAYGLKSWLPLEPIWAKVMSCVVFMPVYLGGLFLLRLDPEDRMLLGRVMRRLRLWRGSGGGE